ncbi:MAG: hypothetical protein GY796_34520 [Chloroflexi bacterium]|nr:hypothetical protein [Chloroflexota bacterium]
MNETQHGYVSYLLRLWQAQDNGDWVWRASLESSQTGQRWVFANLDDVLAFVRSQTFELSADRGNERTLPGQNKQGDRK